MTGSDSREGAAALYQHEVRALPPGARDVREVAPCPVCRCVESRPMYAIKDMRECVAVCNGCGLGRLDPMPSREEVREFYPDEYYGEPGVKFQSAIERLVRLVGERHIAFLSRGLAKGARVLDVGCGRGVILGALADRGFEVHGVEVSEEATRGADPRARIRITERLEEASYAEAFFDEIVIWHVLEHLHDPRGTLEEAARILKPGGRLIVAVPNFTSFQSRWSGAAWFHLDLPRHLYQFPLDALLRLVEDVGFETGPTYHFSLRQNPFGWIQSYLNRRRGLPRNGLYALLHRRAPGEPPPYDASTRLRLWLWLFVLTPIGVALTGLETLLRNGGTVHIVARRGPER